MQLATTLGELGLWLDLTWLGRELNTEADALTNDDFSSFDEQLRMPIKWADLPCQVLERMVIAGETFLADIVKAREEKQVQSSGPQPRFKKKRVKESWG